MSGRYRRRRSEQSRRLIVSTVPSFKWNTPTVVHDKQEPYVDYPVVYNDTVTNRVFYVEYPFTIATTDLANTTLYKWCGNSWVAMTGLVNVDVVDARGFFSVTTASAATVVVTEHFYL